MDVSVPNFVMQQTSDWPCRFRADRLRLVADVQLRDVLIALIGVNLAGKHLDERGFAGSVFTEENDDFSVSELTTLDRHFEITQRLKCRI